MTTDVAAPVLTFTRTVKAPIEQVYQAFTNQDAISYWFSDDANMRPQAGGHFLLTWFTGFYATGSFVELEENKKIVLNWRGAGETTDSRIEITLEEQGDSVKVNLDYSDFDPEAAETISREWETRLDGLVAALEKGDDERITRRVILGIFPGNITEEDRKANNLPENTAMKANGIIPGYSAESAGLQAGDIITEVKGETVTNDRPSFQILANAGPGDEVPIVYYRNGERHTATLTLKGYPVPAPVADFGELADRTEQVNNGFYEEIAGLMEGAGEEAASKRPAPEEWSAKEVLVHLVLNERFVHDFLGVQVQGPENTPYPCNHPALIAGFLSAYPTAADVLAEYKRALKHTAGILRAFKDNNSGRKAHLWWSNFELDGLVNHTRGHIDQIKAALSA